MRTGSAGENVVWKPAGAQRAALYRRLLRSATKGRAMKRFNPAIWEDFALGPPISFAVKSGSHELANKH
jgi:hypothetical protein